MINNPSYREYDANGNAGIINIIYKKEKKEGFNGKVGTFPEGSGCAFGLSRNPTSHCIRPQITRQRPRSILVVPELPQEQSQYLL